MNRLYIEKITELLEKCTDQSLLALIYQLLAKDAGQ